MTGALDCDGARILEKKVVKDDGVVRFLSMSDSLRTVDRPTWDEVDAYFAGEAGSEIRERVEAYFARHPRMERVVRGYTAGSAESWNMETMFQTLREQLRASGSASHSISHSSSNPTPRSASYDEQVQTSVAGAHKQARGIRWLRANPLASTGIVAALLVGVGLFSGVFSKPARIADATVISEAETGMLIYQTRNAQQSTATLSDGTRIVLNVASVLQVPRNFGRDNRTVQLVGEAYFEVTHQSATPFIVKTHQTATRVLGTEFGVNAYDPAHVRVAVRSGRVAVNRAVVSGREVANVDRDGLVTIRQVAVDPLLGFADGKLILDGVPLREAIPNLERWYDVEIHLADASLGTVALHGALVNGNIDDLSDLLRLAFNARVERRGRVVTVYAPK